MIPANELSAVSPHFPCCGCLSYARLRDLLKLRPRPRNCATAGSSRTRFRNRASRALKTRCDEPPYDQDYYRANNCADESSAFAGLIPPDRLAKVRCYKSSNNSEHRRPDEPGGLMLVSRI